MKLFFDESGYSGCIMPNKNGQLFNDGQRHFVLGSVFVADKEDEIEILNKYRQFKNRFGFIGEIKGSELMTQRNNEALKYFITNAYSGIGSDKSIVPSGASAVTSSVSPTSVVSEEK